MFKRDEMHKLGAGEYVLAMFEATSKSGILMLTDSSNSLRVHTMQWSREEALWLAEYIEQLCEQLKAIAPLWDKLGATREENSHILSPQLLDVWDTYVRMFPFEPPEPGLRYTILDGRYRDMSEAPEAREQYERYRTAVMQECLQRLPRKGTHPYDVIIRSIRYTRIASLGAPEIILRNEARRLAEAMVMYHFRRIAN